MPRRFFALFAQHRLIGGAFVLAVTQAAASVMGLLRDNILNRTFPPDSGIVDVYFASFRLSDLLFQVTIMAGISTVLVPLLSRYAAHDRAKDTSELLSAVMAAGSIVFGVLALVLAVFFHRIAPILVSFQGEQLQTYILFGRLALLSNVLMVWGNALGQYLITMQRYWVYGITPVLYTIGTVLGTLLLSARFGALAPMIGTIAGAVIYVALRLAGAVRSGFRIMPRLWHDDLRTMGWLMLPRMVALGALQAELLFFDSLASGLDSGAITINANARNFQSALVGVIGIALAQSAFPLLSAAAARNDAPRFRLYIRKGLLTILSLTVPGAILLVLLTPIAAYLVHLQSVYAVFRICLLLYALSIPFESVNHLLLRSYYALHRTTLPAVCNVVNGTTAMIASFLLVPTLGVYALPVGFCIGQTAQATGLALGLLHKRSKTTTSSSPV